MRNAKPLIIGIIFLALLLAGYISLHTYNQKKIEEQEAQALIDTMFGTSLNTTDKKPASSSNTNDGNNQNSTGAANNTTDAGQTPAQNSSNSMPTSGIIVNSDSLGNVGEGIPLNSEGEFTVFSIELDDISAFGFTNDMGEALNFTKNDSDWVLDSDPSAIVKQETVDGLALSLSGLTAVDIIQDGNPSDFGFDKPTGEFYVKTVSETYTITYGIRNKITSEYYYILNDDKSLIYYTAGGLMGLKSSMGLSNVVE